MTLDDKVLKLKELLGQYPEMENPDVFDEELEKRRKLYAEIRQEVEQLIKDMESNWVEVERNWVEDAWKRVKDKKGG